jgi:hypothetical protein
MGAVIGKAGCNINRIRTESGAHVKAEKRGGQVDRVVEITGNAEQLQRGCEILVQVLEFELPDKLLPNIRDVKVRRPFSKQDENQCCHIADTIYVQMFTSFSLPCSHRPFPQYKLNSNVICVQLPSSLYCRFTLRMKQPWEIATIIKAPSTTHSHYLKITITTPVWVCKECRPMTITTASQAVMT